MRRRDTILNGILFLLLAASVACTKDDMPQPAAPRDTPTPVTLSNPYNASQARSAIDGENLPEGEDVFRMIAYAGITTPLADWSSPYFPQTPVNNAANALTLATPRYYPVDPVLNLFFYAWSPAETSFVPGTTTTPPTAHYTLTGAEDIIAAQVTTGHTKASPTPPNFQFTHKLMQVNFQVQKELGVLTSLLVTKIEILGIKISARLNVATGELSFDATPVADLVAYSNTEGITISTTPVAVGNSLMIEPQSTLTVKITAAGVVYSNVKVTMQEGKAGENCLVTLTFKLPLTRSVSPQIEAVTTPLSTQQPEA